MKLLTKRNIVCYCIIAVLFIGSLIAWLLLAVNNDYDKRLAAIYKNGELVRVVSFADSPRYSFTVGTSENGINNIDVVGEYIVVSEANCPDKICVGNRRYYGDRIPVICLPNRLEIRMVGMEKSDLDAVTW